MHSFPQPFCSDTGSRGCSMTDDSWAEMVRDMAYLLKHCTGYVNSGQRSHGVCSVQGQVQACAHSQLQDMTAGLCQQLLAQLWESQGVCCCAAVQGVVALCTAIVVLVSGEASGALPGQVPMQFQSNHARL